jgi:hypothetical protein
MGSTVIRQKIIFEDGRHGGCEFETVHEKAMNEIAADHHQHCNRRLGANSIDDCFKFGTTIPAHRRNGSKHKALYRSLVGGKARIVRRQLLDTLYPFTPESKSHTQSFMLVSFIFVANMASYGQRDELDELFGQAAFAVLGKLLERYKCRGLVPRATEELTQITEALDPWCQQFRQIGPQLRDIQTFDSFAHITQSTRNNH